MRRAFWTLGLGGLLALAAGCGSQTGSNPSGQAGSAIAPSATVSFPTDPALATGDPGLATAALDTLPQGSLPDSLIAKTDPLRRLPQVRAGRSNPFAALAVNPVVVAAPSVSPAARVPAAPQVLPTIVGGAAPNVPSPQSLPNLPNGSLPLIPVATTGALPPAPVVSSSLAQQIRISGAIQVGDRLSIIIEVPDEHTSRSVSVGDYIGNGSVLVKRIEMRSSQEPRVIFEENGVDVVREVGDVSPLMSAL